MKATRPSRRSSPTTSRDNPGVKANLCRILMQGRLGGTGKMIILPVDQGFEHGPARSFAPNPAAYDPHYHYQLAIDAGLNAYAAPLGMIEAGADTFAGQIPTILKVNSANSLIPEAAVKDQAITGSVDDALRLGCAAIGFTIYPGSSAGLEMFEEISAMREEAARKGVATVIWSYPRGEDLSKDGETAIDVGAYAAQIAALLGAHIIKVKLSTDHLEQAEAKKVYEKHAVDVAYAGGARPALRAGGLRRSADRRLFGWRSEGRGRGLRGRARHPRRRRQRLDHRPQHLPALARGCDGDARPAGRDLQGKGLAGATTAKLSGIPNLQDFCNDRGQRQQVGHDRRKCTPRPNRATAAWAVRSSVSSRWR